MNREEIERFREHADMEGVPLGLITDEEVADLMAFKHWRLRLALAVLGETARREVLRLLDAMASAVRRASNR